MESSCFFEGLAERMRNPRYAQRLVMGFLDDGDSPDDAVRLAIAAMGVENFSEVSGIKKRRVSMLEQGKEEFDSRTLSKCLAVFGLKLSATEDKTVKFPPPIISFS